MCSTVNFPHMPLDKFSWRKMVEMLRASGNEATIHSGEWKNKTVLDYCKPTPYWALAGAPEQGFDPEDTRHFRNKKGKKGGAFGEEPLPEEKKHIFMAELDSLNMRMAIQQRQAEEARAADNEKRKRDRENEQMVKDREKDTNDIMADMTRQYKAT